MFISFWMPNTCFLVNSYILNDIEQLLEELRVKQKQEEKMQEELDDLKESLKADKQNLDAVTSDRNRLLSLCNEKDKELQVMINGSFISALLIN